MRTCICITRSTNHCYDMGHERQTTSSTSILPYGVLAEGINSFPLCCLGTSRETGQCLCLTPTNTPHSRSRLPRRRHSWRAQEHTSSPLRHRLCHPMLHPRINFLGHPRLRPASMEYRQPNNQRSNQSQRYRRGSLRRLIWPPVSWTFEHYSRSSGYGILWFCGSGCLQSLVCPQRCC